MRRQIGRFKIGARGRKAYKKARWKRMFTRNERKVYNFFSKVLDIPPYEGTLAKNYEEYVRKKRRKNMGRNKEPKSSDAIMSDIESGQKA